MYNCSQRKIWQPGRRLYISQFSRTGVLSACSAVYTGGPCVDGCQRVVNLLICCRYKESLQAASSFISEAWPDNAEQALVLNLGPAWMNVDSYSLFRNNVIEIPFKYWESPPGLGLCPLDVLFTVCSSISSWLTLHDGNFVVRVISHRLQMQTAPQACWCVLKMLNNLTSQHDYRAGFAHTELLGGRNALPALLDGVLPRLQPGASEHCCCTGIFAAAQDIGRPAARCAVRVVRYAIAPWPL